MIKSILVASDASESSREAVELAADLAAKHQVPLNILHVMRDMQLPEGLQKMAEVEHIHGPRTQVLQFVAQRILNEAKEQAKQAGAKDIRTIFGEGDPASAIINHAKERDSGLIVLGSRGLGKVKGMLLGSVSNKVSQLSNINVLIVK